MLRRKGALSMFATGLLLVGVAGTSCSDPDRTYDDDGSSGAVGGARDGAGDAGATGTQGGATDPGEGGGAGRVEPNRGDPCTRDDDCDDGSACTGVEECVDEVCQEGVAVECSSGQTCFDLDTGDTRCFAEKESTWLLFNMTATGSEQTKLYALQVKRGHYDEPVVISTTLADNQYVLRGEWSPDGKHLAYLTREISTDRPYLRAYVVDMSGEEPGSPVPLGDLSVNFIWWAPNSRGVLLRDVDDALHLVRLGADGPEDPLRVTELSHNATYVAWAPDSESVAYVSSDAFWVDVSGTPTEPQPLGTDAYEVLFGAGNDFLAFYAAQGPVYTVPLPPPATDPATRINGPTIDNDDVYGLYWAPNGKYFIYPTAEVASGEGELYLADLTGALPSTNPIITDIATSTFSLWGAFGCWSPDSSMFSYRRPGTTANYNMASVYRLASDDSESIGTVPQLAGACWSKTGKYLHATIQANSSAAAEFRLYEESGSSYSTLLPVQTGDTDDEFTASFASDDSALTLRRGNSSENEFFYVDLRNGLDAVTTEPQKLNVTHRSLWESWSQGGAFVVFHGERDDEDAHDIYLVDVTGAAPGALKKLTLGASSNSPAQWQPVP